MIFFTSDSHYFHKNIIRYANRPFDSVEEMNRIMIDRWNSVVRTDDVVWHLGDFALGGQEKNLRTIVPQLNGTIHLILGNHDDVDAVEKAGVFASVQNAAHIYADNESVYLHHYACRVWPKSHRGGFMLYGHSHGELAPVARSLDVGVDAWDFTPVTMRQIKQRLDEQGLLDVFTPHHGRDHRTQDSVP